jgi:hypothetical protein
MIIIIIIILHFQHSGIGTAAPNLENDLGCFEKW